MSLFVYSIYELDLNLLYEDSEQYITLLKWTSSKKKKKNLSLHTINVKVEKGQSEYSPYMNRCY